MKSLRLVYLVTIIILHSSSRPVYGNTIYAEISYGELVDKITILVIKSQRINDHNKLHNVTRELNSLQKIFDENIGDREDVAQLQAELQKVNEILWDVEDSLRAKERVKDFNNEFIQLARDVYFTNDKRCAIKRKINDLLASQIVEEKSYEDYA